MMSYLSNAPLIKIKLLSSAIISSFHQNKKKQTSKQTKQQQQNCLIVRINIQIHIFNSDNFLGSTIL